MAEKNHNQQGAILVMAMSLMAILLSIALTFAVFIISDIKQAQQIDNAVVAYYAAEAGLEKSLFLLRQEANTPEVKTAATLKMLASSGTLSQNKAAWNINQSTDYEAIFFRQRLYNGQNAKLYFLGRSATPRVNSIESFKLNWEKGDGSPKLEISLTQLKPALSSEGVLVYFTDTKDVQISDSDEVGPRCYDFKDLDVQGNANLSDYAVEIKVLGGSGSYVKNLTITGYNAEAGIGDCDTSDYNKQYNKQAISNLTLRSVGSFNQSQQQIFAQITPVSPVSGLLGFVLFSEADIAKGY